MTEREKEIFDEMLAALKAVVNWYGGLESRRDRFNRSFC